MFLFWLKNVWLNSTYNKNHFTAMYKERIMCSVLTNILVKRQCVLLKLSE